MAEITTKPCSGRLGPFFFAAVFLCGITALWGETESSASLEDLIGRPVRIRTSGGGSFQGVLQTVAQDRVELVETDGRITQISRDAVESYKVLEEGGDIRSFYQDSASNRLIIMPTGFAMDTGEFHVCDQEIVVITSSYGLSDNISLWAGISPVAAVLSGRFILTLSDNFALSPGSFAGIEWVGVAGGPVSGMLLPYMIASLGDPDNNISAGAAAAFSFGEDGFETLGFVAALAGKIVMTATTAIVTENWIIWSKRDDQWDAIPTVAILGAVFRIAGDRFSWDIGAILPLTIEHTGIKGFFDGTFIPIPWISLTYRVQ